MSNNYQDHISVASCGETHHGGRRIQSQGAHCFQTIRFKGRSMFDDTRYFAEDVATMNMTAGQLLLRLVLEFRLARRPALL